MPTKSGKPPRPTHLSELCSACGHYEVHPDYAAWSCEHGTWNLADDFDNGQDPPQAPADVRAELLASLDEDELRALLAAKAADTPPAADPVVDAPADVDGATAKKTTTAKATKAAAPKA